MASKRLDEKEFKKSRTITLLEFLRLESETLAEFRQDFTKGHEGGEADEAILLLMMIVPAVLSKLAHNLFDESEPAMDETQDADRMEKK